jgi:carbon starvation protein CstA
MALFSWANQSISAIALWIEPYIYTKENLIIALIPAFFHNVSARVFSLYDPTIGFDSI